MLQTTCFLCRRLTFLALPRRNPLGFASNQVINVSRARSNQAPIQRSVDPIPETTHVDRDVLLYSSSNRRFYMYMTLFGAVQLMFWMQMSFASEETYKRRKLLEEKSVAEGIEPPSFLPTPAPKDTRWYVRYIHAFGMFGAAHPLGMGISYLVIGTTITLGTFMFSLRSVHQLGLLKGGQRFSITTYGLFGRFRTFEAPLGDVSTEVSRSMITGALPLKVKGRAWHFLLDHSGKFHNPTLFDATAGRVRRWRQ